METISICLQINRKNNKQIETQREKNSPNENRIRFRDVREENMKLCRKRYIYCLRLQYARCSPVCVCIVCVFVARMQLIFVYFRNKRREKNGSKHRNHTDIREQSKRPINEDRSDAWICVYTVHVSVANNRRASFRFCFAREKSRFMTNISLFLISFHLRRC